MDYRDFGDTGLRVSELGLGCSPLGGGLFHKDDAESTRVLARAVDAGVNFFDTSDNYSMGHSERLIGEAIKGRRDRFVVATKGGAAFQSVGRIALALRPILRPARGLLKGARRSLNLMRDKRKLYDYSPEHLGAAVDASLRRLQTDYIDIYQLYNPETFQIEGFAFCETLERMRDQGKIRFYGISARDADDALLCLTHPGIKSIQIALSLLDPEATERLLAEARAKGVGIIARSPLAQGLLTDATGHTMADESSHVTPAQIQYRRQQAKSFAFLVRPGRTLAQAALRYALQQDGASVVIPSAISLSELDENLGALAAPPLSADELAEIDRMQNAPANAA